MNVASSMESQSMSQKEQPKQGSQISTAGTRPQLNLDNTIMPATSSLLTPQQSAPLSQSPHHGERHKLHGAVPISVTPDSLFELLNSMNTARIEVNTSTVKGVGQLMDNFKKDLWATTCRHIVNDRS